MPSRKIPLICNEYYHVFNRGIDRRVLFFTAADYRRFLSAIEFYQFHQRPIKFSRFYKLEQSEKQEILVGLKLGKRDVSIISYCLMSNHFHLLLKQESVGGISEYMRNLQNSFARFSNCNNERCGPLLMPKFKATHISTHEQLMHVSRYIHLNPYTSSITGTLEDTLKYPWSSLKSYYFDEESFLEKELILHNFSSKNSFIQTLEDQAQYQKFLHNI